MISAWWLFLIVPVAMVLGLVLAALLGANNITLRDWLYGIDHLTDAEIVEHVRTEWRREYGEWTE